MDARLERNLVFYEHEQLVFVGITGAMEDISVAIPKISGVYQEIELAPVQKQYSRDFIAGFMTNPVRDITLDQYGPCENGLVGFSLDKASLIKTLGDIVRVTGFTPDSEKNAEAARTWRREFEIEKMTYAMCEKIAEALRKPIESCFGAVKYINFLTQYMGIDEEIARKTAERKFNLHLS